MKSLRILLFVFVCSLLPFTLQAQKSKAFKAYASFDAGSWSEAIDEFKEAYDLVEKSEKTAILYKIAECYQKTNDPRSAAAWYKKAIDKNYPDPIAYYHYAEVLKMNENYEESKAMFQKYKSLVPESKEVDAQIVSCDLAREWSENPGSYQVENMKYFNSRQSDYSPAYARSDNQEVYFTSARDESNGTQVHGVTGQSFSDIYVSRMDRKGKWSTPVPLDEAVNSEFEEGATVLSADFNTLYFTRCKTAKGKTFGCQIYYCKRDGETWGKAQAIDIAGDSIVIAHPAISPDELTLYFVSDMEGGVGAKDLWKIIRSSKTGEWSKPENLGEPINTTGDEMFPFVHPDGTLYFSSNGQIGMGGLDIFKATKNENGSWNIENMKPPINSPADDFGITFEKNTERGFFSSTRAGKADDNIYSFALPPLRFNLSGLIKDEKTDQPLSDATVKSIGSDGIQLEVKTSKDGTFKFSLKANTDYVFLATRQGYLNGKERETTKGLSRSKDFFTTIFLSSIGKPIELPNIFYDFNKWDLRPESMVSLDRLVETLNDNPNVTIELMSHTDSRGTEQFNIELSQKRAQSVVNYLIEKGITNDRLSAKGYGESQPKTVDKRLAEENKFLKEGQVLTEEFINNLGSLEQQETCFQINRRTEFRVLRTDYIPR